MKRIASVIAAGAALTACGTQPIGPPLAPTPYPPPYPSASVFREQDFAWSTQPGTGRIEGVLAYHAGGGPYTCKDVILAPETPWSRARMRALYLSSTAAAVPVEEVRARTTEEHAQQYAHYARQTSCDAGGGFTFSNLPNGAWYVITVATPVGGGARMALMRRVSTYGDVSHVVLR